MSKQPPQPKDWTSGVSEFWAQDPALRHRDTQYPVISFDSEIQKPRVHVLCLSQNGAWESANINTIDTLSDYLAGPRPPTSTNRTVYVVEGVTPEVVEILRSHFPIEPSFFMRHERPVVYTSEHDRFHDTVRLPSQLDIEDNFQIKYYEMLHLSQQPTSFYMHCARTARHIGISRLSGKYQHTAIARRKCSFWSQRCSGDAWNAIILCDPPIKQVWIGAPEDRVQMQSISTEPFQGGYPSFINSSAMSIEPTQGPPRTSMLDDLAFYFKHHPGVMHNTDDPQIASYFMRKIAASHYMQLVAYTASILSNRHWSLSRRDSLKELERFTEIEKEWSDLQGLHRRCCEYIEDTEAALLNLGIPMSRPEPSFRMWDDDANFQYIYMRFNDCKARTEVMINSITGLASMSGTRQALIEAQRSLRTTKSGRTLSFIGLLFIPLAYVAGIFSMPGTFAPGSSDFGKYWEVAAPLALGLFLLATLLELGYDDAAKWSPSTFAENSGYNRMRGGGSQNPGRTSIGKTNGTV